MRSKTLPRQPRESRTLLTMFETVSIAFVVFGLRFLVLESPKSIEKFLRRLNRVGSGGDGAAHDKIIRAGFEGFVGCQNALLIAQFGALRADAGRHDQKIVAAERPHRRNFARRTNHAIQTGFLRQASQSFHRVARRFIQADFG